jgi:glycosyltransferase involved in cell wall biosynthesis
VRVGFNGLLLSYGQWYRSAGISRYIDRTLAALSTVGSTESFVAFVGPDVPRDVPALSWLTTVRSPLPTTRPLVRIAWEQLVLPWQARKHRVDVLHCPAYVAPLVGGTNAVVTFHDLSYFFLPEAFNRGNRAYLQVFSRLTARRAKRFIAVSESTRGDLVRRLGVNADRIDVVYNGVDARFRREDSSVVEAFRWTHGLPDRFVLYLGTLEPRKNVATLLRAYAHARHRGVTEPLVIAGGRGWGDLALGQLAIHLGIASWIRWVGFAPMDEQPLWYNAATLFAYPSLYEGFGLPALEAMACGTPVIASNRSSLPEVVGDAGALVDPADSEAWGDRLYSLLNDDDCLADLARRGVERAARFNWNVAAQSTMSTYRRALGKT